MDKAFEQIQPELMAGENPLWCGKPEDGFYLRGQDLAIIPFSLFWTGGSLFFVFVGAAAGAPLIFQLFGLPFVLIGLYLLVGRFFYERWQRRNTYYAVTPKRVLIKTTVFPATTTSISLTSVSEISTQPRSGGRGDVILQSLSGSGQGTVVPRLENLAQFRDVYETVLAAQSKLG